MLTEVQSLLNTAETSLKRHPIGGYVSENLSSEKNSRSFLTYEQTKLLNDLKLPINVQIGGLNLSAHQLLDLSLSQFFEFEIDPRTNLVLSIEGEEIAKAKFVVSDEKLGIEIIEV